MDTKIYSISQITALIENCLGNEFFEVWVEGEVSDLRIPSSGHMYFILKDSSAQLKAVLFRGQQRSIPFKPQNGQMLIARGSINVYAKKGEYQLIVNCIEPLGIGALQLAFEQLKEKLAKEGLFDNDKKKPIPFWPKKIGIVTSPTGAAIQDILNIITRRFATIQILINPTLVQGDNAAFEIANAISELDGYPEIEVIIVTRGGGSLEDLWAFNEELVARAIYNCRTPVISAVGHEIDYTISDFVADLRAPTPSAAAELVIINKSELYQRLDELELRLIRNIKNRIIELKDKILNLTKRLEQSHPSDQILNLKIILNNYMKRLISSEKHLLKEKQNHMLALTSRLESLSPLSILDRGYCICFKQPDGIIIKDTGNLKIGDNVCIKFYKGKAFCDVKTIE